MESPNKCRVNSGFTLVELSIVMIIIGLLIGGIFGGMKLIDNANVQKTVQDLKSIQSAILTFKDTYRALPGDYRYASSRLPNCSVAPCSTNGNGDRILDIGADPYLNSVVITDERYTFWQHLLAANLLSFDVQNGSTSLEFGEGQPSSPVGGGYRMGRHTGGVWGSTGWIPNGAHQVIITGSSAGNVWTDPNNNVVSCQSIRNIDIKMDDGIPVSGRYGPFPWNCVDPDNSPNSVYNSGGLSELNSSFYFPGW